MGHSAEYVIVVGAEDGDFFGDVDIAPSAHFADPQRPGVVDNKHRCRLGKAKEQAKIVVCLVNLRGLGTAFAQYGAEHNGWYPKGAPWGGGTDTWEVVLQPYYQNFGLIHCPADKAQRPWTYGVGWTSIIPEKDRHERSYAININIASLGVSEAGDLYSPPYNGNSDFPWPGWVSNENEIPSLSETILVGEMWDSIYWGTVPFPGTYGAWWGYGIAQNYSTDPPCDHTATDNVHRNNDAANYLFCDGHAILLPATDPNLTDESGYYYWHWER